MFGLRELKFQEQLLPISGFDGLVEVQALPPNPSHEKKLSSPERLRLCTQFLSTLT